MSWRFKNAIDQDEDDEKYCNNEDGDGDGDEDQDNHYVDDDQDKAHYEQRDQQLYDGKQKKDKQENQVQQQQQDPLDAYMNELGTDQNQKRFNRNSNNDEDEQQPGSDIGQHENNKQPQFNENNSQQQQQQQIYDSEHQGEYKFNNNDKNRKIIQPLKPFDFSSVHLENFVKDFYSGKQHEDIKNMSTEVYNKLIKEHEIKITGQNPPKPIISFGHLPLTEKMFSIIAEQGFEHPTPIQAQALPCALSGRDVVGIAKTGSGKTLAYVWPMIIHVNNKVDAKKGDGPSALVLAPTRQLCQQIYVQARRYAKKQHIKIDCLLGGENKHEQWKSLKAGTDILIASPGRLIQFLRKKATNLMRVTYLVLDQADRMLSLGFEQQIRSIISQTREDRQTLLFTATMKKNMQILVGDIITNPLRIIIGDQSAANEDVKQEVVIVKEEEEKVQWLQRKLGELVKQGKVLIFVNLRKDCEKIGQFIETMIGQKVLVLHGDKNQYQRTTIMNDFKTKSSILVATEIAARGIDVKNIKTVINYECPKTIQAYIHRIGRAGRAGQAGTSYTFLMPNNCRFAISLIEIFQHSGYPVTQQLEQLAMLDDHFRRKRITAKMGVTFAKGKDATKYLNHALKRQRRGYNRAGLGYDQTKKKSEQPASAYLNLNEQSQKMKTASIHELSTMIRNRISQTKIENKHGKNFIRSEHDQLQNKIKEPTVFYYKKKQQ